MTSAMEHCADKRHGTLCRQILEHCDDKGMEHCDDRCHGTL